MTTASVSFDTVPAGEEVGMAIEIPGELIATLGQKKRPPVRVTLNGFTYRTTVSVYDGRFYLPVRREIRQAAKLKPGISVTVLLEPDDEPRTVELPDDLAQAFDQDPEAAAAYECLAYTHRKEYVAWITGAKRPETRATRLAKTLTMLREGRKAP